MIGHFPGGSAPCPPLIYTSVLNIYNQKTMNIWTMGIKNSRKKTYRKKPFSEERLHSKNCPLISKVNRLSTEDFWTCILYNQKTLKIWSMGIQYSGENTSQIKPSRKKLSILRQLIVSQTIFISIFSIGCPIELKLCEVLFQTDAKNFRFLSWKTKSFIPKKNMS